VASGDPTPQAHWEERAQRQRRPAFALVAPAAKPTLFVLRDRPEALPWPENRSSAFRAANFHPRLFAGLFLREDLQLRTSLGLPAPSKRRSP